MSKTKTKKSHHKKNKTHRKRTHKKRTHNRTHRNKKTRPLASKGVSIFTIPEKTQSEIILVDNRETGNMIPGLRNM